jgi:hypothetical protein
LGVPFGFWVWRPQEKQVIVGGKGVGGIAFLGRSGALDAAAAVRQTRGACALRVGQLRDGQTLDGTFWQLIGGTRMPLSAQSGRSFRYDYEYGRRVTYVDPAFLLLLPKGEILVIVVGVPVLPSAVIVVG